ncbi:MAG TPA: DUF4397 domain-containing protein [Gemmatimonadales bacterium]|nr:DUF4397 domain-containing protein [Gemmatimonadales bacterium]
MKLRIFGLALIAALGLAACGDDDDNDITARLRVVHLSPDASAVDVFVGDTREFTNVTYAVPTDYQDVRTGSQTIRFVATGDTTTLGSSSEDLELSESYTVLATGFAEAVTPLLLTDTTDAPADGEIRLRLVHASPSTGAVDVYVGDPTEDIAAVNPTVSNVAFGDVSNYLRLDEGTYRIRLTAVGDTEPLIDEELTLSSGAVRTVIARDATGGGIPAEVVVLDDRS